MDNLGLGVMINMLGGNEKTVNTINGALNKNIIKMFIEKNRWCEDSLVIEFDDKNKIRIFDDGQSCCENRYIHTDDDLSAFVPSKLISVSLRKAPSIEDEYGEHEVQFLIIKTSLGEFTLETHNEHNGYYGGFWVVAKPITE